jgi:glucose/arabinose dehydrogenase
MGGFCPIRLCAIRRGSELCEAILRISDLRSDFKCERLVEIGVATFMGRTGVFEVSNRVRASTARAAVRDEQPEKCFTPFKEGSQAKGWGSQPSLSRVSISFSVNMLIM